MNTGHKDILLHICCGPCSLHPIRELRREGLEPRGYFFNPNIQPFTEFKKRLAALRCIAVNEGLSLQTEESYPLEDWLKRTLQAENRCLECYRWRLSAAAARAAMEGYHFYSTTLLVSPYQQHDMIAQVATEEGERYDIEFIYRDWRPGWPAAKQEIRERGIYLQAYCGCILSERDRYYRRREAGR